MFRELHLTSPDMTGPDVTAAQKLLRKNAFGNFLPGPVVSVVDGDFGPESARACVRAKFWLGFSDANVKGYYGQKLAAYLKGDADLPTEYLRRRDKRLKAQAQKTLGEKAVDRAMKDLGMSENPAESNICPISRRWGIIGPWCNMAVSEWYIDSGSHVFTERVDWAYVPYFLAAAEHASYNGLSIVRWETLKTGDPVCFDWNDDGVADHIGLFIKKLGSDKFQTIEGNTSAGSNSNGGQVQVRERYLSDVSIYNHLPAFARVGR